MFLDNGSPLFNQVVRNVPVLAPKHQALVTRDVREQSLNSMTGIPHNEDKGEQDKEERISEETTTEGVLGGLNQPESEETQAQEKKALVAAVVKKCKLYR